MTDQAAKLIKMIHQGIVTVEEALEVAGLTDADRAAIKEAE